MPIQINMPIGGVAKKLKKICSDVAISIDESSVDLVCLDPSRTTAVAMLNIGSNIGEQKQYIELDVNDLSKLGAVSLDIDVKQDYVLYARYTTKAGVEVEKELVGRQTDVDYGVIYGLLSSGEQSYAVVSGKELRSALEEIEVEQGDEVSIILKQGAIEIVNESKVSKKLKAKLKVNASSGEFNVKLPSIVSDAVKILASVSGELKLSIVENGILRIDALAAKLSVFISPIA
ncbi:MAG: hypothetical protein QXY39_01935 [Thermofilaceae archaeon]